MRSIKNIPESLFIALVVVAMSAWLESALKEHPNYVLAVIGIVMFLALQISFWWHEKRLSKRMGIERERLNKIREERIRLRKPYENRLEISSLLSRMHEQAVSFTKKQLEVDIPKKKWERMTKKINKIIPRLTLISLLLLPRLEWLGKTKSIKTMIASFMLDITGILKTYGYGSLDVEGEQTYAILYNTVKEYEVVLPDKINKEIEGSILWSKMLSTMQIFDPSQPAFNKLELNPKFTNRFQFLLPATHMMLSQSQGRIHESIERWLTGE